MDILLSCYATAMILRRLMESLIGYGFVIVITSK